MSKTMNQLLQLGQNTEKFHPTAVKNYQEFLNDISKAVPLDAITEDDAKKFLFGSEYINYIDNISSLFEWLNKCFLNNKVYPDSFPVWGTSGFKGLLLRLYQRKLYCQMETDAHNREQVRAQQESRQKELEWQKAQVEHQLWADRLNKSLDTLKANLSKNTCPAFQTPAWLKDYSPSVWIKEPSGPTEDWFTANKNIPIAANKSKLEKSLQNHVDISYFYQDYYLPSVQYETVSPQLVSVKGHPLKTKPGVPCLKWWLATHIISIAEFHVNDRTIPDVRYGYELQGQCTPEKLGTVYYGPEFWKYQNALVVPVSLLAVLAWGKAQLTGIEIVKRSAPWNVYRVNGFPDEITLHDDFRRFVCDMTKKTSLDKALLDRKMCDTETAGLVKVTLEKLKEPEAPAAVPGTTSEPESTGNPYMDVVTALAGLGYPNSGAAGAAKYVCQKYPHETLVDKIKIALQYLSQ